MHRCERHFFPEERGKFIAALPAISMAATEAQFQVAAEEERARSAEELLLLIDGSGERRPEPRHGRVSRGVTPDDFGTLETWCATPTKANYQLTVRARGPRRAGRARAGASTGAASGTSPAEGRSLPKRAETAAAAKRSTADSNWASSTGQWKLMP